MQRRQADEKMNQIKKNAFTSISSSLGWISFTSFLLCAFFASYLQQKLKASKVSSIMAQANGLSVLNRYGTLTNFICPTQGSVQKLSLVAFADAGHSKSSSQLYFITGIIIGLI